MGVPTPNPQAENQCRSTTPLTGSRSPDGPGCAGAAPCPGAPGGPAAGAVRTASPGPAQGWSDAGRTDLHP